MSILVIAEHDNAGLKPVTLNVLAAAQAIAAHTGTEIELLVAGAQCQAAADAAAQIPCVNRVLLADSSVYEQQLAENIAPLILSLAAGRSHILAPATSQGKNCLPRVAALLDVNQLSDVIAVQAADTFQRPVYAGNAIATVQSADSVKLLTVRGTAFDPVADSGGAAVIDSVATTDASPHCRFISEALAESDRPELTSATTIISGGRGMGNGENFGLLYGVADKLGAAVGASRAAVDAGFVPNDMQVGQTGKVVAPQLYVAVGISGAIQHLAGMKDSKVIVAINKDEEAPIFQVADYGLVGDLFEVLPQLDQQL